MYSLLLLFFIYYSLQIKNALRYSRRISYFEKIILYVFHYSCAITLQEHTMLTSITIMDSITNSCTVSPEIHYFSSMIFIKYTYQYSLSLKHQNSSKASKNHFLLLFPNVPLSIGTQCPRLNHTKFFYYLHLKVHTSRIDNNSIKEYT